MRFCTSPATTTSLAPLARLMPSATTGSPFQRAEVRGGGGGVGDGAEVVEPHFAAGEQRDHGAGEFVQRFGAGQSPDRLIVLADFGAAASEIDIGAAQALADIDRGEARGP